MRCFLVLSLLCVNAFGAFNERYVRQGGHYLNSGSTNTDAASKTYTGGDWNATTDTYTAPVGADFTGVANGQSVALYHDGDTVPTTNQYLVGTISSLNTGARTFVLNTGKVLLGTEVTTGTGNRTVRIGGAWAPPTGTNGFPFNFCSSGLSATTTDPVRLNVKSDCVMQPTSVITVAGTNFIIEGYGTTEGDLAARPEIDGKTSTPNTPFIVMNITGTGVVLRNLWFDGNYTGTPAPGASTGNYMVTIASTNTVIDHCLFTDSWRGCIQIGGSADKSGARITNNDFHNYNKDDASDFGAIIAVEESTIMWNRFGTPSPAVAGGDSIAVHIDTAIGENVTVMFNTITNQTKAGISLASAVCGVIAHNTIDNPASYGIIYLATTASGLLIRDNIISRAPVAIRSHSGISGFSGLQITNNVYYDCATKFSQVNASLTDGSETDLTASANPFADGTNVGTTGNLGLNNTASAGALARGAALGFFQPTTSHFSAPGVSHADIGAMQSEASGGTPGASGPRSNQVPSLKF